MEITITGVLKDRSFEADRGHFRIYFQLSCEPDGAWAQLFDGVWENTIYSMKRRAGIEGDALWVLCPPEEVQKYHVEELKKAVAETNSRFKAWQANEAAARQRKADVEKQGQKRLDSLDSLDLGS
jgi:hypothetical protein